MHHLLFLLQFFVLLDHSLCHLSKFNINYEQLLLLFLQFCLLNIQLLNFLFCLYTFNQQYFENTVNMIYFLYWKIILLVATSHHAVQCINCVLELVRTYCQGFHDEYQGRPQLACDQAGGQESWVASSG